jgi:hypothetical protein
MKTVFKVTSDSQWKDQFLQSVQKLALCGDYKGALKVTREGMSKFPKEFICQYQHAKILGDYADELPSARKRKLKSESIRILRPLLRRLGGQTLGVRFGVCLNYYYQTEDFKGMYRYGRRFQKADRQKAFYAQGLAGALLAQAFDKKSKSAFAKSWAQKAVKAWSRYKLEDDPYYFAHYSAAKAFALAGNSKRALKHLRHAAKLGRRPISDWEFADVMEILNRKL